MMPRQPDESDPDEEAVVAPLDVEPEERGDLAADEVEDDGEDETLLPPDDDPPPHCPCRFFNFAAFEVGAGAGGLDCERVDLGTDTLVGL